MTKTNIKKALTEVQNTNQYKFNEPFQSILDKMYRVYRTGLYPEFEDLKEFALKTQLIEEVDQDAFGIL